MWSGMLLQLGSAGLIGLPLFWYLQSNAGVEVRIQELSLPLTAALQGDFSALSQNVLSGLAVFSFVGDDFWRYNIPGRPLLSPLLGLLFGIGLLVALWAVLRSFIQQNKKQPLRSAACFLALVWLVLGLAPVLVTGASLSTTQAMGLQPVLFLFPALALGAVLQLQMGGARLGERRWAWLLVVLIFGVTAVFTIRDYFITWANAPEVRVQYETAMATAVNYLNEQDRESAAISTITPGPFHTPALAAMMLTNENMKLRWFDGRSSLIIPDDEAGLVILSGFAPLATGLQEYWEIEPETIIPQRQSDIDQPLTVYKLNAAEWLAANEAQFKLLPEVQFGEAAALLGYDLGDTAVVPGETMHLQLVTLWRLQQAAEDVHLFTHISGADGVLFAQADGFSAPSESWQMGDLLLQLHQIPIPPGTAVANYPITVGLYTCQNEACTQTERLPLFVDGQPQGDQLFLQDLTIGE
jgi:hypothetical protein